MNNCRGTLIDDDGILIVSTVQQMMMIGSRGFAYNVPAELLHHMTEGRIVAWGTGGEDEYSMEVVVADEPPAESEGAFRLSALASDTGLVMPYSQFSYAAACNSGVVENIPGLAIRFPIPAGEHQVFLAVSGSGYVITIVSSRFTLVPVGDRLPVLPATVA